MRTRRFARVLFAPVLALAAIGALSVTGATAAGAARPFGGLSFGNNPGGRFGHHPYPPPFFGNSYTCNGANGGIIPEGTYGSMFITGTCYMPAGNITIRGDLDIAPGALLDAVTPGDPASAPAVPATVVVGGNVNVGSGAVLLLGCSPNISCSNPPAISYDRINGNLTGYGAQGVVVHSASIGGNVNLVGGGGGASAENCSAVTIPQTGPVPPAPWSQDPNLAFTPVYSDFEDATVGGNFTMSGLTSCWLGSLRDQVGGSATWDNNTMGDPDAMEIGSNLINGNMACSGNSEGGTAGVQFGDGGAAPSTVGGFGLGQCGFNVLQPNPAPEALAQESPPETCTPTTCIPEHISVSKWSLGTYLGTHAQEGPSQVSLPIGTTESGDSLAAEVNNIVFGGSGLTGSGTYDPAQPLGSTGEAVAVTTYPNGSESFTAFDNCTCTFQGQTGAVSIRAYGTVSPNGSTSGTFLITSGGGSIGALTTLAGYGTFSSWGQPAGTLGLVEHLKIT
jgi:hypothetical protein